MPDARSAGAAAEPVVMVPVWFTVTVDPSPPAPPVPPTAPAIEALYLLWVAEA